MATISQLFAQKRCVFSIECFPPKQTTKFPAMQQTLRQMKDLHPGFISVTYGAGGSGGGVSTVEVALLPQKRAAGRTARPHPVHGQR